METSSIIDNCKLLFSYFGWYSILLVIGTTLLMIPINLLYKKIMAKDNLERLRKVVSAISVYIVSLALVAFFTGVVIKAPLTAEYLFGATLPCGLLSMLLWAVIKIVRDYGILPIIKIITENKEAKKWITDLGLNSSVVSLIIDNINKYLSNTDTKTIEDVVAKTTEINELIKQYISGFVTGEDNIVVATNNIMEMIKSKFPNAETNTEQTEDATKREEVVIEEQKEDATTSQANQQ